MCLWYKYDYIFWNCKKVHDKNYSLGRKKYKIKLEPLIKPGQKEAIKNYNQKDAEPSLNEL